MRRIHGVSFSSGSSIRLGPYFIMKMPDYISTLESDHPNMKNRLRDIDGYWIGTYVNCSDNGKAQELSDAIFFRFENISRLMIGLRSNRYHVGVITPRLYRTQEIHITSKDGYLNGMHALGPFEDIPIDDPFFTSASNGLVRLWDFPLDTPPASLYGRILSAVDWIGRAVNEIEDAKALIQFTFAIETMLKPDQRGLISPSITHSLAESSAFILGTTLEERCKIDSDVRKIYGDRSSIVHGLGSGIEPGSDQVAFEIGRDLIIRFLTHPNLSKMRTTEEVYSWIKQQRYGVP